MRLRKLTSEWGMDYEGLTGPGECRGRGYAHHTQGYAHHAGMERKRLRMCASCQAASKEI